MGLLVAGAGLARSGKQRLIFFCILCTIFACWAQAQNCPTLPCTADLAVYTVDPQPPLETNDAKPPSPTPTTKPYTRPLTTSSQSSSTTLSITSSRASSTVLSTSSSTVSTSPASSTSSSTPSSASLSTPSSTSLSTPSSTPSIISSTTPTAPSSSKASSTPSNTSSLSLSSTRKPTSRGPLPISNPPFTTPSIVPSNSTQSPLTGTYTSLLLPSFLTSSSPTQPTITRAPSSGFPSNSRNGTSATSCGHCSVLAREISIYFWPTASFKTSCAGGRSVQQATSTNPASAGITHAPNATRTLASMRAPGGGGGYDVVDGITFTYPSTYVSLIGAISVSDSCGLKGGHYTNPKPFPIQAITTASYFDWPSSCRPQGNSVAAVINTLAQSDIACPTWGVSNPFTTTCDGEVYLTATYGEPYNPVILVPTEILAIDPAWGACTNVPSKGPFVLPCGLYDPPRALHTQPSMLAPNDPNGADQASPKPVIQGPEPTAPPDSGMTFHSPADDPKMVPSDNKDPPKPPSGVGGDEQRANDGQANPGQPAQAAQSNNEGSNAPSPNSDSQDGGDPGGKNQGGNHGGVDPAGNQGGNPSPQTKPQGASSNDNPSNNPGNTGQSPPKGPQTVQVNQPGAEGSPVPKPADQGPPPPQGSNPNQAPSNPAENPKSNTGNQPASQEANTGGNPPKPGNQAPLGPIAQTTVMLGGASQASPGQPAPSIGSIINDAFGGGAPASPGTSGNPAGNEGGNAGANPGGNANVNGNTNGNPGTNAGSNNGANAGTNPAVNEGANSGGNAAGAPVPFTPHLVTVQGQTLQVNNPSVVAVAGKTLTPGGPAVSSGGNYFSLASGGNLVAGTLAPPSPVMTFAGSSITADAFSHFVIAGQTLTPGGSINVDGTPISLPSAGNAAVIGSSSQSLVNPTPASALGLLSLAGSTYTADPSSQFIISGQTLSPGSTINVAGTPISLFPSGTAAVIGSSTQLLAPAPTVLNAPPLLTLNGATYTANAAGAFVIASQTLTPGGSVTISGTPIFEAGGTSPAYAVVGSSTQSLAHASAIATNAPVLTFHGHTYTADAQSNFIIEGQTLKPGSDITVDGTRISEPAAAVTGSGGSGGYVVIGSSTESLSSAPITPADIFTVDGTVFTANPTGFVVDGTTVLPGGPAATVNGTTISLEAGGTLDVGTSRIALPSETAPMIFEGRASRVKKGMAYMELRYLMAGLVLALLGWVL